VITDAKSFITFGQDGNAAVSEAGENGEPPAKKPAQGETAVRVRVRGFDRGLQVSFGHLRFERVAF